LRDCGLGAGQVGAVESEPDVGGERVFIRVRAELCRPQVAIVKRRLIPQQRDIVRHLGHATANRQGVRDIEQRA
jgi:hypothetical protein